MTTAFRELPAAIVGELGEAAGAALMRADGASMIALCRIDTGGAPVLERGHVIGPTGNLVLPDFQAFNWRGQGVCFVEIKTYAQAALNDKFSLRVHGIPVRLFEHYKNVERETGIRVVLGINELDTGELRLCELSITSLSLFPCLCRGGCKSKNSNAHIPSRTGIREMQWYFDRDEFPIVYKHEKRTIERLRKEHSRLLGGHASQRHGDRLAATSDPAFLKSWGAWAERRPGFKPGSCSRCGATPHALIAMEPGDARSIGGEQALAPWFLCQPCWSRT